MSDMPTALAPSVEGTGVDLGYFLRVATHEIANPLGAISMNAELAKLLLEREQPARASEALKRLLDDCTRLGTLIQGLRRFGSGLDRHAHETVALSALIAEAIDVAAREGAGGKIPLVRIDGADELVRVDRSAIATAIAGLLRNAAEADSEMVLIQLGEQDDWLTIDIRDNGTGIPPESRSKAPDAFYSTHRSDGKSGLGLTLAREVLHAHGGRLAISANYPQGTCIALRLPSVSKTAQV